MNREFYGHRIGMNLDDDSFLNVLCGYVAILFCESEAWNFVGICYFSHCLFMIEFPPRCPQVVWCHRGEIELFSTALAQGRLIGRMWSAKEKSLQMLCHNRELNPDQGENRRWDTFIPPLSYHDPDHREDRQWDTFIFPLSCYNRFSALGEGKFDEELLFTVRAWDLMTPIPFMKLNIYAPAFLTYKVP